MIVSNRYALSLFEIDSNININELENAFKDNEELFSVLVAENINITDKIEIFTKIFKGKIEDVLFNFVAVLIEKKRINLFFEICDEYTKMSNDKNKKLIAFVTSAVELTDTQKNDLAIKLNKKTGKEITLETIVDTSILGGVIVKYDNTLIDGSVKTKLLNLNKQIKEVGV